MLTPFDPADVAAIKTRFVRQPFLRHTKLPPLGANTLAEDVEIWVHIAKSPDG